MRYIRKRIEVEAIALSGATSIDKGDGAAYRGAAGDYLVVYDAVDAAGEASNVQKIVPKEEFEQDFEPVDKAQTLEAAKVSAEAKRVSGEPGE